LGGAGWLSDVCRRVAIMRSGEISEKRCAYCGEPLVFNAVGIMAWRIGNDFVCNEFCAEGVSSERVVSKPLAPQQPAGRAAAR
jgi:hypothetical protein